MKHQHQSNQGYQQHNQNNGQSSIRIHNNGWVKQNGNIQSERKYFFSAVKEPVTSTQPIMYNDNRDDW